MTLLPMFGAAALLLAPMTAHAQQTATISVTVAHADLDLATPHGLAALDRRIVHAAREACGYASPTDLAGRNHLTSCREQARASVTAQRDELAAAARPAQVAARN